MRQIGGNDSVVRTIDRRMVQNKGECLSSFIPQHLQRLSEGGGKRGKFRGQYGRKTVNVTGLKYDKRGEALLVNVSAFLILFTA